MLTLTSCPENLPPRRRLTLRPHRFQLCVRCQANPAGFWVSGTPGSVTRRPWCLTCSAPAFHDRGQFWRVCGHFWP